MSAINKIKSNNDKITTTKIKLLIKVVIIIKMDNNLINPRKSIVICVGLGLQYLRMNF